MQNALTHLNALININGKILPPDQAHVSIYDRSYLYGDSLYEVARSYAGKFFLLKDHLKRLQNSAQLCRMKLHQTLDHYEKEVYRTFNAFRALPGNKNTEAYLRIVISRGEGKIGFGLSGIYTPTLYTLIMQPVEPPGREQFQKGLKLKVSGRLRNDRRALDPAMKSGNYLNSLLAYLEANDEGFDDALLCNANGHITEGTTFNIFYIKKGIIATPPLDIGILDGITRRRVIQIAHSLNLPVREVRFPKERLYEADEVFISSSVREIFPVRVIDQVQIKLKSKNSQIVPLLHKEYQKEILRA